MIKPDVKEIKRYLGYKNNELDVLTEELIEDCIREINSVINPRFYYREFDLIIENEPEIQIAGTRTMSENLSKNLKDCHQVLLFGATLGFEIDYLIQKYSKKEMSRVIIIQAAAAAMIEEYCNQKNQWLKELYKERGLYLRPRFSPGYGDFSLDYQKTLFELLRLQMTTGMVLTDQFLMIPSKSVTAVIGISKKQKTCSIAGCESCEKIDCEYRRC